MTRLPPPLGRCIDTHTDARVPRVSHCRCEIDARVASLPCQYTRLAVQQKYQSSKPENGESFSHVGRGGGRWAGAVPPRSAPPLACLCLFDSTPTAGSRETSEEETRNKETRPAQTKRQPEPSQSLKPYSPHTLRQAAGVLPSQPAHKPSSQRPSAPRATTSVEEVGCGTAREGGAPSSSPPHAIAWVLGVRVDATSSSVEGKRLWTGAEAVTGLGRQSRARAEHSG